MKIRYWGTAAAEGMPCSFCNCMVCNEARRRGGRNIRFRSQTLIEDNLLIDFGPDAYTNSVRNGYNMANLEYLLITHTHRDHFVPLELLSRGTMMAHGLRHETLRVYGPSDIIPLFYKGTEGTYGQRLVDTGRVALEALKTFVTVQIGEYKVTPLKATHDTFEPFVYSIEKGDKALLYLHDTGILPDESFDCLARLGTKYDLVSYDCTHLGHSSTKACGPNASHMGLPEGILTRDRLDKSGLLKPNALAVLNHFSYYHELESLYEFFAPIAEKEGFIVSYDGLELEF